MNLMLFAAEELSADARLALTAQDRRTQHLNKVLKVAVGDSIKVGQVNGDIGSGTILSVSDKGVELSITLVSAPPPGLNLTLILALPRPKMMRRVVENIAALGVKHLILINAYKVEKSYWQTPWLSAEVLEHHCQLGLEQAGDTHMPRIETRKLFKPFVEDVLPPLVAGRSAWVAHPGGTQGIPATPQSMVLAIGPEGGFTSYEVEKFVEAGCRQFNLGPRILRVETVIPALLGRLFL